MSGSLVVENTVAAPWWAEVTRKQWYALFAGFIGYVLDAFDVMLYAFCLTTIMQAWALKPAQAGFMLTVTLFSSSIGGILFGAVADKAGRKLALMLTVILFSVCSGLSGLSQNLVQLGIFRALLGLGMGGEWAAGVLLISETWPAHHRGKAIGIMQSGWAIGYILAAVAAATILLLFGWRVMFMLGVVPALFAIWVRTKVDEPAIWVKTRQAQRDKGVSSFGFWQIFSPRLLRTTAICTMVSAFAPTIIGALSVSFGLGGALTFLALAFGAGAVSIFLLPETCGTELA